MTKQQEAKGLQAIDVELTDLQQDRLTALVARQKPDAHTGLISLKDKAEVFEGQIHIRDERVKTEETYITGFSPHDQTALVAGQLASGRVFYAEVRYGFTDDEFTRRQTVEAFIT